ncbi:MAG: hypothetical protein HY916_03775 [Desulfovibrio sp.]|nr:hypothetical protein [Desulfovibrio sp.]
MRFLGVALVLVVVRAVLARVLMDMARAFGVVVRMLMLMLVFVAVGVLVRMRMLAHAGVRVRMLMRVAVLVRMVVAVLMVALHGRLLSLPGVKILTPI